MGGEIEARWVEDHKFEAVDDDGADRLYISDDGGETLEGPYSEEEADEILWKRACDGEAVEALMVY